MDPSRTETFQTILREIELASLRLNVAANVAFYTDTPPNRPLATRIVQTENRLSRSTSRLFSGGTNNAAALTNENSGSARFTQCSNRSYDAETRFYHPQLIRPTPVWKLTPLRRHIFHTERQMHRNVADPCLPTPNSLNETLNSQSSESKRILSALQDQPRARVRCRRSAELLQPAAMETRNRQQYLKRDDDSNNTRFSRKSRQIYTCCKPSEQSLPVYESPINYSNRNLLDLVANITASSVVTPTQIANDGQSNSSRASPRMIGWNLRLSDIQECRFCGFRESVFDPWQGQPY